MKRLVSLDIARAICVILVVLGHYLPVDAPVWYVYIHDMIYLFHMPLFFFASGFVYASQTTADISYMEFILKKVKRLMVPYFSTSLIVICLKLATQHFTLVDNPVTWSSFYRILYLPEAGYFLWFIWALWWMFVLSPIFRSKTGRWLLLGISILLHFIPDLPVENIFCLREFKYMFLYFNIGVICTYYKDYLLKHLNLTGTIILFILSAFMIEHFESLDFLRFVPAIAGIACIMKISLFAERNTANKIVGALLTVYASSYIIYLFHTTFNGFARLILSRFPLLLDGSNNFYFTVGALLIVLCGILCPMLLKNYVLDNSRITRFLFGL